MKFLMYAFNIVADGTFKFSHCIPNRLRDTTIIYGDKKYFVSG